MWFLLEESVGTHIAATIGKLASKSRGTMVTHWGTDSTVLNVGKLKWLPLVLADILRSEVGCGFYLKIRSETHIATTIGELASKSWYYRGYSLEDRFGQPGIVRTVLRLATLPLSV